MGAGDWWSGDLDVRRPQREIELAMQADDLHIVPLTTWSNRNNDWAKTKLPKQLVATFDGNRFYQLDGRPRRPNRRPDRLFNLPEPLPLEGGRKETPDCSTPLIPQLAALKTAQPASGSTSPCPARGTCRSLMQDKSTRIACCPSYLQRDKVDAARQGRPLDKSMYLGEEGPARFAQDVYFHMLNVGLRVLPSAGSGASGTVGNPVGYNRVYVWVEKDSLSYDAWWATVSLL